MVHQSFLLLWCIKSLVIVVVHQNFLVVHQIFRIVVVHQNFIIMVHQNFRIVVVHQTRIVQFQTRTSLLLARR